MRLADWYFLLPILLIPFAHRWWRMRNAPAKVCFSLPVPPQAAVTSPMKVFLAVKYIGLACLLLALARPQNGIKQSNRWVNGIDIMMVLDFSASMKIEDLGERSRTEIAKDMMERFIKARESDRIGFVAFSGQPITLAPPTLDYGLVLKQLHDFQIGMLSDGTAIGDALALAVSHLRNSKAKSRVIILLTDGDNNLGQIDPATAGEIAAGFNIRVYTIAIGREGRVKMPIDTQTPFGNTIRTYQWFDNALNPELLQGIAKVTGGRFYRVTDENALESVFKEINSLEKNEVKITENLQYEEFFQTPLKLAILLFAISMLLEQGWWRVLP